jgi:hypothetical protein
LKIDNGTGGGGFIRTIPIYPSGETCTLPPSSDPQGNYLNGSFGPAKCRIIIGLNY